MQVMEKEETGLRASVLRAESISKVFGTKSVFREISLDVAEGEVVTLIGPSGSGKTTFLRTLNHLEEPSEGVVLLDGKPLGQRLRNAAWLPDSAQLRADQQRIGFVFQQFNLFPHMTAAENVWHAPVRVKGEDKTEAMARARELLERVGLEQQADQKPATLSGGQQQRVAIARALAMRPRLLLFDEPTSALDPEMTQEVLRTIQGLAREGVTMVIVTHEMSFARRISDRVVVMEDGLIIEQGPATDIFSDPENVRTRAFLASMSE